MIGVTGGGDRQETDADEIPHTLDQGGGLDEGYGDRKAVDSVVGGRLGLDLGAAAELMRSCGGKLIEANQDERGGGSEVKLILPSHRKI